MMFKYALPFLLVTNTVNADKGALKGSSSTGNRQAQSNLLGLTNVLGNLGDFNNALSLAGLPTGSLVCDTLQAVPGIAEGGSLVCANSGPLTSTNLGGCLSSLIPGITLSSSDGSGLKVEVLNGNSILETVNQGAGIVVQVADAAAVSVDVPLVNSLLGGLLNPSQVLNVLGTDGSLLGSLPPLGLGGGTNFFGIVSPTDAIGSLLLQSTGNQGLLGGLLGPLLGITQTLNNVCFVPKPPGPGPTPSGNPPSGSPPSGSPPSGSPPSGSPPSGSPPSGGSPSRPSGGAPTGTAPAPTGTGNPPSGGPGAGPTGSCVTGLLQCTATSDCCTGFVCRKKGTKGKATKKKLCRKCKKARKFCTDSTSCCPGLKCVNKKCVAS